MDRIVKVFCTGAARARLARQHFVIERYDGFVLAKVPQGKLPQLSRAYPVEDITDLYTIHAGERVINTSRPRFDRQGRLHPHLAYRGVRPLPPGPHHHLVQFIGPIKGTWLEAVKKAGGEPRAPYADFAYVVRADDEALRRIMALPFVRWAGHLRHEDRMALSLSWTGRKSSALPRSPARPATLPGVYAVDFFGSKDLANALPRIGTLGVKILERGSKGRVLIVRATGGEGQRRQALARLAAIHGVRAIREWSLAQPCNDIAAGIMATARAMGRPGLGLSGKGENIGVCDTGLDTGRPRDIHPDFAGRVPWIKSYPIRRVLDEFILNPGADEGPSDTHTGHGTHVAGSLLGNGAVSRRIKGKGVAGPLRGFAYRARLFFQAVEQQVEWKDPAHRAMFGSSFNAGIPSDLGDLFEEPYRRGVRIHSNSWSNKEKAGGNYSLASEQLDDFVWRHKDFCVVASAGNGGIAPRGRNGRGTITPKSVNPPATAKNCITVGACENRRPSFNRETYGKHNAKLYRGTRFRNEPMADDPDRVVPFSSRGPTRDGRVKPDVVAPGTYILSTRSRVISNTTKGWAKFPASRFYFYLGGTSQATPLTAGAVALVREYLRTRERIRKPTAALLKAAIIAGATRLPGCAPAGAVLDCHQGFGRVNLDAVLAPPKPATSRFAEVKPGLRTGEIHTFLLQVKSGNAPLRVVLAYSDFPGSPDDSGSKLVNNLNLVLTAPNGTRYNGNQPRPNGGEFDARNNVEVVHVQKPAAGDWRVEVVGFNVPHPPQDFALVSIAHT
jgi:subtilisin family serine protease